MAAVHPDWFKGWKVPSYWLKMAAVHPDWFKGLKAISYWLKMAAVHPDKKYWRYLPIGWKWQRFIRIGSKCWMYLHIGWKWRLSVPVRWVQVRDDLSDEVHDPAPVVPQRLVVDHVLQVQLAEGGKVVEHQRLHWSHTRRCLCGHLTGKNCETNSVAQTS